MARVAMRKQLALAVPDSMYNRICQIADREKKSKSEVVREIIQKHMSTALKSKKK